ncbi:MAG: mevalonate kinase [Spirochaetaceae bacterium]|nr:MAG: mevalonate kinase [Spirochaetaceae bacterium]
MRERSLSAPGKLLLFGEHAAVYGYPAVGIALDRGLSLTFTPRRAGGPKGETRCRWRMKMQGHADPTVALDEERFSHHLEEALGRYGRAGAHLPPGDITLYPDLPLGSGFGSSAALCTALARLAWESAPEPELLWRFAHDLEKYFHGTPSGIDTGLSALGGTQAFHFSVSGALPSASPCVLPAMHLVAGSIPREKDTLTLVAGVRRRLEERTAETESLLRTLGETSSSVIREANRGESSLARFGEAMNVAQEILQRLELSVPLLERILARGRKAGAAGAKLSGAGGGGAFYLACADGATARAVESAIRELLPPGSTLFHLRTGPHKRNQAEGITPGQTSQRN